MPYIHNRIDVAVRPSTSTQAALIKKNRRLKAEVETLRKKIQRVKDQRPEIADETDSIRGKKALKKVVESLTLREKIVQLLRRNVHK